MAVLLAEACAVIMNSTLIKENFWYIISLYILQQHHLNFPIVMSENDMWIQLCNYYWWIAVILSKNRQMPKFTHHQYSFLYGIQDTIIIFM